MTAPLSRRHFLTTVSAVGAIASSFAFNSRRGQAASITSTRLVVARRTIEVNGKSAYVFGIRQPDGTPGLILDPGQRFNITLENQTAERTIVHWHGQTPPVRQDGVSDTELEALIESGASQGYDFSPRSGTYWMHSHHGLQEQLLLAAPLIVRTEEDLRTDAQEVTVLLQDFTFRDPAEVLAQLTGRAATAQNPPAMPSLHADTMARHGMEVHGMTTNSRASMQMIPKQAGPGMQKAGMVRWIFRWSYALKELSRWRCANLISFTRSL